VKECWGPAISRVWLRNRVFVVVVVVVVVVTGGPVRSSLCWTSQQDTAVELVRPRLARLPILHLALTVGSP
jgi:hypothetical protein